MSSLVGPGGASLLAMVLVPGYCRHRAVLCFELTTILHTLYQALWRRLECQADHKGVYYVLHTAVIIMAFETYHKNDDHS